MYSHASRLVVSGREQTVANRASSEHVNNDPLRLSRAKQALLTPPAALPVGASMSKAASAQSMHDPIHTGKDLKYCHSLKANVKAQSGRGTTVLVASVDHVCTLRFRSRIMKLFTADRKGWLRRNRALLDSDRRARPKRYQVMAKSNMADWNKHGAVVEQRIRGVAGQVQTPTYRVRYMFVRPWLNGRAMPDRPS